MHYSRRAFSVRFTITDAYVFVLLITLSSIIVCIFYFSFCFINFLYFLFAKGTPRHNKRSINQSINLSLSLSLSLSVGNPAGCSNAPLYLIELFERPAPIERSSRHQAPKFFTVPSFQTSSVLMSYHFWQ